MRAVTHTAAARLQPLVGALAPRVYALAGALVALALGVRIVLGHLAGALPFGGRVSAGDGGGGEGGGQTGAAATPGHKRGVRARARASRGNDSQSALSFGGGACAGGRRREGDRRPRNETNGGGGGAARARIVLSTAPSLPLPPSAHRRRQAAHNAVSHGAGGQVAVPRQAQQR